MKYEDNPKIICRSKNKERRAKREINRILNKKRLDAITLQAIGLKTTAPERSSGKKLYSPAYSVQSLCRNRDHDGDGEQKSFYF